MPKQFRAFRKKYKATQKKQVRRVKYAIKKPLFSIPTLTFLGSLLVCLIAWMVISGGAPKLQTSDSNIVILNYDKKQQTVPTRAKNVGALLNRLHITLGQGDIVEPSKDTPIDSDNFRVNVYRATPVTIIDGDQKTFAYSAAATSRSIVKQSGISVYPEDKLTLLPTYNFLTDSSVGQRVVIDRATPVNLNLYGTAIAMRTHAKTVQDLLREKDIVLREGDSVQPSKDTPITASTAVFVIHKGKQIVSQESEVAMPTETVEDNSLTFGTTAVRQQGSPGKKITTYEIELQNGKEVGRRAIQEVVSSEPVKQIIAKGTYVDIAKDRTSVMLAAGIARSDFTYADFIIEHESHWNPSAQNARSGAYGLCQALPGSKMASAGSDWSTNPVTQLKWCNGYAQRYGGWAGAYQYWMAHKYW